MKATIRQLRSSTKEIFNAVSRGATVLVTNHRKPCAKIIPINSAEKSVSKDNIYGMWKDRKEMNDVRAYVRSLRKWRRVA